MFRFAALLLVSVGFAQGQLHLITGAFNQSWNLRFQSALFAVGKDGKITEKLELVASDSGFFWMGLSYDLRQAAILVPGNPSSVSFLNLNTAEVLKECDFPEFLQVGDRQWLADVPGRGASLELVQSGANYLRDPKKLFTLLADPSIPCEKSLREVAVEQVRYAVALGAAGVGDFIMSDGMDFVHAGPSGSLSRWIVPRQEVALGYIIPSDLLARAEPRNVLVDANNSKVLVVALGYYPRFLLLVFRKSDKTWHVVPERLFPVGIRAFGKYVAMTEGTIKKTVAAQLKEHPGMVNISPDVWEDIGPGKSEWTADNSPTGPSQIESFATSTLAFPGRLHIFDSETEKVHSIETNQGDSEILLIERGTVYYRVSDRLYSAPISDKGLGKAQLIAMDDVVRDAHWAFLTR